MSDRRMPLSRILFHRMQNRWLSLRRLSLLQMTFGEMAFNSLIFGEKTTVGDLKFGEMAFGEVAFGDLTFSELTEHLLYRHPLCIIRRSVTVLGQYIFNDQWSYSVLSVCRLWDHRMPLHRLSNCWMSLCQTLFNQISNWQMPFHCMSLCRMTFCIMTSSDFTFNEMTFVEMLFGKMTFCEVLGNRSCKHNYIFCTHPSLSYLFTEEWLAACRHFHSGSALRTLLLFGDRAFLSLALVPGTVLPVMLSVQSMYFFRVL